MPLCRQRVSLSHLCAGESQVEINTEQDSKVFGVCSVRRAPSGMHRSACRTIDSLCRRNLVSHTRLTSSTSFAGLSSSSETSRVCGGESLPFRNSKLSETLKKDVKTNILFLFASKPLNGPERLDSSGDLCERRCACFHRLRIAGVCFKSENL